MLSRLTSCFAGFLQFPVEEAAPERNLAAVAAGLERLTPPAPSLVVLPELWGTGFAYDALPTLARRTPELLAELRRLAARHSVHLAGSLPEEADGRYYNTLFLTGPEGTIGRYRKQRLFTPMREDLHFTAGADDHPPQGLKTPFGRVGTLICFDLRFPELARIQAAQGAGLFVISAQWPAVRLPHWRILVQARAIENQAYVIACNCCGMTGGTEFGGHSLIVAPDGAILKEAGDQAEADGVMLEPALLAAVRGRFNTIPGPAYSGFPLAGPSSRERM